jgi:protoheme ferro-lyase
MSGPPIGVLVMAYGTASGPDDVERYYTDIRGGRRPSPEHLEELRERYAAVGNRFPLLDITRQQAEGLERELNRDEGGRVPRVPGDEALAPVHRPRRSIGCARTGSNARSGS